MHCLQYAICLLAPRSVIAIINTIPWYIKATVYLSNTSNSFRIQKNPGVFSNPGQAVRCGNIPLCIDRGWAANALSHIDAIPFPCGLRVSCCCCLVLANRKEVIQPLRELLKTEGAGFDSSIQIIPPSKSCFLPQTQSTSSPSDAGEYPTRSRTIV